MTTLRSPCEIADFVVRRDRAFSPLVHAIGPPPTRRSARVDQRFSDLTRSITFQLLATKAAATIHARVEELCDRELTPTAILGVGHRALRNAGLSHAKAGAMLDLARRTLDGEVHFSQHGRYDDDAVARELAMVRGIGPWTAQMYLMHTLGRRDVWPIGDYGVRAGWSLLHGRRDTISAGALRPEGDRFAGERSSVAWYCWRAVELSRQRER